MLNCVVIGVARIHQSGPDFLDVGLGSERIHTAGLGGLACHES